MGKPKPKTLGTWPSKANALDHLQTLAAPVVCRTTTYSVPVPPSCRGRVMVTVKEMDRVPPSVTVSWHDDRRNETYENWPIPMDAVAELRRQISDAIAELTPPR
jgi:hypothetical protein